MERKFDIIALGELNVDLILNRIKGFPEIGKEIVADDFLMTLGSSTAIFAANAASLGSSVAFLGMVGKDGFGNYIEESLRKRRVDTSLLIRSEKYDTGMTVVMNYDQDRANVTYPGAMNFMGLDEISGDAIGQAKHVHISSLFLQENLRRDIPGILEFIRKCGATVSLDTQWDPSEKWDFDFRKLLPMINVFMPNEKELMCLTRCSDLDAAIAAVSDYVNVMVVKQGVRGATVVLKGGERHEMPALLNEHVVDAIGAGDSFNAGFISAYVRGCPINECLSDGILTGAINTTAAGGTGAFSSPESIRVAARTFGKEIKI
jgi:sugar/nucleoside kinase (ribokinase family)